MDYGERYTDKKISAVNRELRKTYRTAQAELKKKLSDFEKRHAKENQRKKDQLAAGEISQQDYKDWMTGQVFIRNQWQANLRQVCQVMQDCNKQAMNIVNTSRFDVFAENYNFNAWQAERSIAVSFTLYNAESVARLINGDPQMLPEWKIDEPKDYRWNQKRVNNIIRQAIIQGEGIPEITDRLCRDLATSNEAKMRMFARTALGAAQSAGRQKQMEDAAAMGIEVHKRWIAAHDSRTRDAHRDLDGQEVPYDKPFESELGEILFPKDPTAEPANVFNCRCTMRTIYPKYEDRSKQYGEDETIDGQSYEEWKKSKQKRGEVAKEKTTSGIYGKTSKYNDKEHSFNVLIKQLEAEYSDLYKQGIDLLVKGEVEEYNKTDKRMLEIDTQIAKLRDKVTEIQAERSRYLSEHGEKDISAYFGKIKGAHNAAIDAKSVNVITGDPRTQNNCAPCALAYDARRRGIDCTARESFSTNNAEITTWWEGMKFDYAARYWGTEAREEIREIANQWGDGARGLVQVDWDDFMGHTFAFEVINGRCTFIDPQTGVMNADELFIAAKPGSARYARTDDKELTKAAIFGLKGKDK